jgi:2-keto-3-deoxy-L-rhamnonate aldolase RhmA
MQRSTGPIAAPGRIASFRDRLLARELLVGTFLKTPSAAVAEIIGMSGLDCTCVDAEHAPFDRAALDTVVLAARAHDLPSLVRVTQADPSEILNALDVGATGVVLPHIASAAAAAQAAAACRYGRNGRGYAGSSRAAGYTTRSMASIIAAANASVCVVAQIEDEAALQQIDAIAAVDGIDCLFIGRMDLTVSLGAASPDEPRVIEAVEAICAAGRRHGRCVGMFTTTTAEAIRWRAEGASFFLLGSDQQWVLQGSRELAAAFAR